MMYCKRYNKVSEFSKALEPYARLDIVRYSLIYGIVAGYLEHPDRAPPNLFLLCVYKKDNNVLILSACFTGHPRPLIVVPEKNITSVLLLEAIDQLIDAFVHVEGAPSCKQLRGVYGLTECSSVVSEKLACKFVAITKCLMKCTHYMLSEVNRNVLNICATKQWRIVNANLGNLELAIDWTMAWEVHGNSNFTYDWTRRWVLGKIDDGDCYFLEDRGTLVCLCSTTRKCLGAASIGQVFTPPEFRKRGYAGGLVASVCRILLGEGNTKILLFADEKNPFSNACYIGVGFLAICEYGEYSYTSDEASDTCNEG